MKSHYRRWQVAVGWVLFLVIMGLVGRVDYNSQQAMLDEKISIRNQLQAQYEADLGTTVLYYNVRGGQK